LAGDLSLLHDRNGFLLDPDPADPDPTLVLVVVDNDGGGIFHFLPQGRHAPGFERLFGTPHGVDLAHVAATHDLAHVPVATPDALRTAIADALTTGGRTLVHVRTDRTDNVRV